MTIHSEIKNFLNNNQLIKAEESFSTTQKFINKAGIVPFMRSPLRYCVMKPCAARPELGIPEFQICKGTRMFYRGNSWQDIKGKYKADELKAEGLKAEELLAGQSIVEELPIEELPVTALREGIEELGLILENIKNIMPLGIYSFTSASQHRNIDLWLLAAEMKEENQFLPLAEIKSVTAERKWMTLAEFRKHGRADHAHILNLIEEKLAK